MEQKPVLKLARKNTPMVMVEQHTLAMSALEKLTDEELASLKFMMPWQHQADDAAVDPDGFPLGLSGEKEEVNREFLQRACWDKFQGNPHVNTAIRGQVGRMTGFGFEITSEIRVIHEAIKETETDPRNRLYSFWPKFVARGFIEGELFLLLTAHLTGFVEVDFIDPLSVAGPGDGGIITHPTKATMPLIYGVKFGTETVHIPSIFLGYYPDMLDAVKGESGFSVDALKGSKSDDDKFKKTGGFRRFIVSWDRGFITKRNVSHLRTILEWLNHYENLKKYEIDHKKSSGAYLWIIKMEDPKTFRAWLSMSDEERRKTGIMAKKTPGSTLILPPGMTIEAINPKLASISNTDTDIFHMVTGGLNEPEDISSGESKGTFASVKASRGPMSDRTSDEIADFQRFLIYDFYRAVFFLKGITKGFPQEFKIREAVDFKNQKPVFEKVIYMPHELVDITFPISEVIDAEARAKAYLGVKHGSLNDVLGIPNAEIANKLGVGNYRRNRLRHATEQERYPELLPPVDSGGEQKEPGVQKEEGENGDDKKEKKPKLKVPSKK